MAWRNLARNPRRTGITVSGLALALALSIMTWVFFDGFAVASIDALVSSTGHVLIEHRGQLGQQNFYDTVPDTDALIAELEAMPQVESVEPRVSAAALISGEETAAGASIIGIDLQRDSSRRSKQISEGSWLSEDGQVVLGADLARRIEVKVGDEVAVMSQGADGSLANTLWTVVGLVKSGSDTVDRSNAWVSTAEMRETFVLNGAHALAVRLHDAHGSREFVVGLQGRFTGVHEDLSEELPEGADALRDPVDPDKVLVARSWRAVNPMISQYADLTWTWSLITVGFVLATASLGAMNTMLMSVLERTRELGVLMATGLRPPQVVGLVVLENLALGAVALVVGLVLGALGAWWTVDVGLSIEGGDFAFSGIVMEPVFRGAWSVGAFVWPTLVLGIVTFFGSLLPAGRAALLKPVDAMRAQQ